MLSTNELHVKQTRVGERRKMLGGGGGRAQTGLRRPERGAADVFVSAPVCQGILVCTFARAAPSPPLLRATNLLQERRADKRAMAQTPLDAWKGGWENGHRRGVRKTVGTAAGGERQEQKRCGEGDQPSSAQNALTRSALYVNGP